MNETDIPCSDCGTDLVERTIPAGELPVSTGWQGRVRVAECPSCRARYYPTRALAKLSGASTGSRPVGDS